MSQMSDFQKSFLSRGGMQVYTQKEFDEQLSVAKAQIMQVAIETTKTAIAIEREECAKIADEMAKNWETVSDAPLSLAVTIKQCAENIRNRLKK